MTWKCALDLPSHSGTMSSTGGLLRIAPAVIVRLRIPSQNGSKQTAEAVGDVGRRS